MSTKPLVYTVDDDASLNILMKARFEKYDCEIETFTEPKTLFSAIGKRKPDLILVDMNLGLGISGFHVIENVREKLHLTVPILVLSSDHQNTQVAHAIELGATDYLVKPPFRAEFEERLAKYLGAANLPEPRQPELTPIERSHRSAKVDFELSVEEISPIGFTLLSSHLVRKGTVLTLQGDLLRRMKISAERIPVTVTGSASTFSDNRKQYQLRTEIEATNEVLIQELKAFLAKMRLESE